VPVAKPGFPLRVSAVMIDLDGTLADTIPDLAAGANGMLSELGQPTLDVARITTFVGKGIPKLVERTLAESFGAAASDELVERALPVFERHYAAVNGRHSQVYPGVNEALRALGEMKLPLACVTNKSGRFTLPLLEQLGLARHFQQVVAGDTLPKKKPDPAQLLHACRAFDIAPRDMLMIGDSGNDALAARAAGCPVFCVTYGYNEGQDVRALDVDAIVESLTEAVQLIRRG
jgi:phosphoglycolate phosphatase